MSEDFIPTRGSMKKNNEELKFDVVVHQSYKRKERGIESENHTATSKHSATTDPNQVDMKKARYEIIKFGMSGFNTQKKEEAKIQLAIKLGAKPPRNQYKNYKQVIKERKKEKIREQKQKQSQQLMKTKLIRANKSKKNFDKKRKKDKNILEVYGKVKAPNSK